MGNLIMRFHDGQSANDLARLVLVLRKARERLLTPGGPLSDSEPTASTALTFIEVRGAQPVTGLARVSPELSRSGYGEVAVTLGTSVRLIITDRAAMERVIYALERVLHDATIAYPTARSLEETAAEIRKRWRWRHPQAVSAL